MGFLGLMPISILGLRKFKYPIYQPISHISNVVIFVTKITNFIPNMSTLNGEHFPYYQLNYGLPSAGQTV